MYLSNLLFFRNFGIGFFLVIFVLLVLYCNRSSNNNIIIRKRLVFNYKIFEIEYYLKLIILGVRVIYLSYC